MLKIRDEKGITLLALVVTIVLLLILSGITISSLAGDNGLINSAIRAKENSEIDGEKEIIETSVVQAMGKDKYGNLGYNGFKKQLDAN